MQPECTCGAITASPGGRIEYQKRIWYPSAQFEAYGDHVRELGEKMNQMQRVINQQGAELKQERQRNRELEEQIDSLREKLSNTYQQLAKIESAITQRAKLI